MSDEQVKITILADTTQLDSEIENKKGQIDALTSEWRARRLEINRGISSTISVINSSLMLYKRMLGFMGRSLDPVQESIVTSIMTSLNAALTIHRTMEAATLGLSGVLTIALSATTLAMSLQQIHETITQLDASRSRLEQAEDRIDQLTLHAFGVY